MRRNVSTARETASRTEMGPRSALDNLRLTNQTKIVSVSNRRHALIEMTRLKKSKEMTEWIESEHPDGLSILEQLTKYPNDYAKLIKQALADFRVVENRAARLLDLEQHKAKESEVNTGVAEFETKLSNLRREREMLRNEIENQKLFGQALQNDANRLRKLLESMQRESKAEKIFVDDTTAPLEERMQAYREERDQLEEALDALQERLLELTHEQTKLLSRQDT